MTNAKLLITRAAVAAAAAVALATTAQAAVAAPTPAAGASERVLLREINQIRAEHGRPALRRVAALERPARAHSGWLLRRGRLVHEGRGGAQFWTRLVAAGYPRSNRMAENLARVAGCRPADAATAAALWMASPPHRANLLDPRLRHIGIGIARSADCGTVVITADFGG